MSLQMHITYNPVKFFDACFILVSVKYHNNYGLITEDPDDEVTENNCPLEYSLFSIIL